MSGDLTVSLIRDRVAAASGLTVAQIVSHRRDPASVDARRIAMFIAHRQTGRSLPVIGRCFGKRCHTTVLESIRVVAARFKVDDLFAAKVEGLELLCLADAELQEGARRPLTVVKTSQETL